MARWNKIGLAIAVAIICAVGGYLWLGKATQKHLPVVPPPAVDSTTLPLVLQGRSYCSMTLPVQTTLSGEVQESLIAVGQTVKKDDILFKLKLSVADATTLSARLNKGASILAIEASIQRLVIQQEQLERNIVETKQLDTLGMASKNYLADMLDLQRITRTQLELTRVSLADAKRAAADDLAVLSKLLGQQVHFGSRPQNIIVRAPQDGNIISINASVREGAVAGGTLCTIGDMDPMIIRGQVHESELPRLQGAENATIALDGGKGEEFEAELSRVSWAALDSNLAAPAYYLFELVVPNPSHKIKDGFKVQITFLPSKSKR